MEDAKKVFGKALKSGHLGLVVKHLNIAPIFCLVLFALAGWCQRQIVLNLRTVSVFWNGVANF